jgi:putative transposase
MPRKPRIFVPGQPQHVIVRGVNREPIFVVEQDYRSFLGRLKEALTKYGCVLHAYVLMTNHVHMLLTASNEEGTGRVLQTLGRYYVQYFNHFNDRTGTLWEGRYKATLVDSEAYLLTCYRYIELNPVRAQMVVHPEEYPWSSYRHNALGQANPVLTRHTIYQELGHDNEAREAAYRALFKAHISEKQLLEIREATNKEWVLGSEYFKMEIYKKVRRRIAPLSRGGDRRSEQFRKSYAINRH